MFLLLLAVVTIEVARADQPVAELKADPNWLATIQKNIEEQEYHPSKQMVGIEGEQLREPKWHISNRAQGFQSFVSKEGWEIVPRPPSKRIDRKDPTKHLKETAAKRDDAPKWYWRYRFSAVSRGSERTKLSSAEVRDENETVYLKYSPSVSEWYKNTRAGIEQGFELKEKPHVKGKGELVLVGDVKTDLAVLNPTKEKIGFSKSSAEVVQYAGLKVTDASGKTLPSWLSYSAKGKAKQILIHIDDAQAVYPVAVDPLATSPSWTGGADQVGAAYGVSVSRAGDVNGDGFSDVVVGACLSDNGQEDEGLAYLYLGSASGLATTAAWTGEENQNFAQYGISVSTAGDVNGDGFSDVLVGANQYDRIVGDEGQAYLYLGSASGLSTTAAWTGGVDEASAYYGFSVSTAGDVNGDGYSDVVVGAVYFALGGELPEGRAYLYLGSASGLATTAAWTGAPGQAQAQYGYSVSTAGDVNGDGFSDVLVGARTYDDPESNEGRAFLYLGSAQGLPTTAAWIGESDQADALYGHSVSSAGDVNGDGFSDVIVGAINYSGPEANEGKAYLYLGSASGLGTAAAWTGEGDQAGAWYGQSVSSAGDSNGDGYSDVVVGAPYFSNGESSEGSAFLYLGSAGGLATTASWTGESNQTSAQFGWSVSTAGDVNGEGASDVVVGANQYDRNVGDEGQAFLYQGTLDATPTPVAISPGSGGLPAPAVTTSGRSATITAPQVTPQLTARARKAAIKKLMQRGLTRAQAVRALLKLKITYIFTVTQGGRASAKASDDAETQASSITRRSKRNQITLSNLPPGTKAASYRIEIATRQPPVVLGTTKPSANTAFTIPAG